MSGENAERARCQRRLQALQRQASIGRARFTLRRLALLLGVGIFAVALNLAVRWWKHSGFDHDTPAEVGMFAAYVILIILINVAVAWGALQREIAKWNERLAQLDRRDHRINDLLRNP